MMPYLSFWILSYSSSLYTFGPVRCGAYFNVLVPWFGQFYSHYLFCFLVFQTISVRVYVIGCVYGICMPSEFGFLCFLKSYLYRRGSMATIVLEIFLLMVALSRKILYRFRYLVSDSIIPIISRCVISDSVINSRRSLALVTTCGFWFTAFWIISLLITSLAVQYLHEE